MNLPGFVFWLDIRVGSRVGCGHKAMATEATSPNTELDIGDISALHEALCPVSAKYKFFGLQIGVDINEIKKIEANYKDSSEFLLEILCSRLYQEPALTCADICKALRSQTVNMPQLANNFQSHFKCKSISDQHKRKNETERESSKKKKAEKVSESAIPLGMSEKEIEDESESENTKSAEVERQVHEKRAEKRAHKKERTVKKPCASEQPEPNEFKEDEMNQIKGKQKQKIQFSEMAASPQSGAESDQKRNKSVKESEKIAPEIMSTDSENESSDACKEKEILLSKAERTGKVRECAAYSEVKYQPQSAKIREVKNEARKKEKQRSTNKQHSVLHRKTAVDVESDEDTSEQPSHKSKNLEAEETESEESFSESTSDESETDSPKHKEKVKPKSPTDTEEMYHESDEEIEKVRVKDKKKLPQKSKVVTAKSSPHSERLVEQKKGKSVGMKEQERESELPAKASRGKLQKPHSQAKERERMKETDSGMKTRKPEAHYSEQASDKSETDCENEESDSGNESSAEVSKAAVEQSKYDSPQGGIQFDHTRKVKVQRESEAASLKYASPGDDEQSDPDHGSRDQEEHRRKKKKHRRESSMTLTAIGSSSPSTSQEERKKQPVSKKQRHRKKHVRKMKEKRERMKRGKEEVAHSSGTDDSSPECDMTKNQYEGETKELVNIFKRFFGKLCRAVFDPVDTAVELQMKGLISIDAMKHMMRSPESQQEKIITLVDWIHEKIKSRPDHLFVIIEVMLENEALQETAREILREIGTQCLVCVMHFDLGSKTLFPAGRVCPVETAAKFPSRVPPSDTAVQSTTGTLSSTAKGM